MSNEFYSQVNVPFSWELEPGVLKATIEDRSSTDTSHVTMDLPLPPYLSESARFCLNGSTRSLVRKGNVNKWDDPFVAAYRKCTEYSNDDEIDACSGMNRTRRNMLTLSCKCSCSVSRDNAVPVRVSHCLKVKAKEEHKERE